MVALNSSKSTANRSPNSALNSWKNFKKMSMNQDKDKSRAVSERNNSPSSSFHEAPRCTHSVKKIIEQEKLFKMQCQDKYKNSSHESSFSTDSSYNASAQRRRRYLDPDDDYNNESNNNCVLHLKKPLSANPEDAKKYYEDRGRMEPIDWNNKSSGSTSGQDKKPEVEKKMEIQKNTTKTVVMPKPEALPEFSHFVENSVSKEAAYTAKGNIERISKTTDSPIFKVQQLINKKPLECVKMSKLVAASFLKASGDPPLLNQVDTFGVLDPSQEIAIHNGNEKPVEAVTNESSKFEEPKQNTTKANGNLDSNKRLNNRLGSENNNGYFDSVGPTKSKPMQPIKLNNCSIGRKSEDKVIKDSKSQRPTHHADDYNMVTYVNTLTDEESAMKRESRKKDMSFEDDLFKFVDNSTESSSQISSPPVSCTRKVSLHSFSFSRLQGLKKKKEQSNKSLDSDDTVNMSSDFESLPASGLSMRLRFEAIKKKKNSKTTNSCDVRENASVLPDGDDADKMLESKNQLLNRCLRASHDYSNVQENNVVEITEVKLGPKPEPLLKPISTRYFAKSSTEAEQLCDDNSNGSKEDITKENEALEKKFESNSDQVTIESSKHDEEETRESIDIIFSSTVSSSEYVDCDDGKTDLDISDIPQSMQLGSTIDHQKSCSDAENQTSEQSNEISENPEAASSPKLSTKSSELEKELDKKHDVPKNEAHVEKPLCVSGNHARNFNDLYDDDDDEEDNSDFEIENVDAWFPGLSSSVKKIKDARSTEIVKGNQISCRSISSSESGFDSSHSNNSSGSENLFQSNKNIFENVKIELSELKTDGFDYQATQSKMLECKQMHNPKKNQNDLLPPCRNDETLVQASLDEIVQENAIEEAANTKSQDVTTLRESEPSPKVIPKKMQKYRKTLQKYKNKCESKADSKEEVDNTQTECSQESQDQRRPLLDEITKHKLHLTLRQFI